MEAILVTVIAVPALLALATVLAYRAWALSGSLGADYMADDADGMSDDDMGARGRRRGFPTRPAVPIPSTPITGKRVPLGLVSQTTAAAAAAGTVISLSCEPQRAYQGERLILSAIDSTGADVLNNIDVTSLKIADVEQLPFAGGEVVPGVLFRFDATNVGLDLSLAKAGIKVTVQARTRVVLGAGVTLTLSGGFVGRVVGQ